MGASLQLATAYPWRSFPNRADDSCAPPLYQGPSLTRPTNSSAATAIQPHLAGVGGLADWCDSGLNGHARKPHLGRSLLGRLINHLPLTDCHYARARMELDVF